MSAMEDPTMELFEPQQLELEPMDDGMEIGPAASAHAVPTATPLAIPPNVPTQSFNMNLTGQLTVIQGVHPQPWEKGRTSRQFTLKIEVPTWSFPMYPSFEGRVRVDVVDTELQPVPAKVQIEDASPSASSGKSGKATKAAHPNTVEFDRNGQVTVSLTVMSSLEDPTKLVHFRFFTEDVAVLLVNQTTDGQLQILKIPIRVTETYSTRLTIVTYPTTQWLPATKKLIMADLEFEATPVVVREKFAATVDAYMKWATAITDRSGQITQQRGLLASDIDYFLSNFFMTGNDVAIDVAHFDNFWNFFGPVLNTLHFKKGMKKLWCDGMILGFLDKRVAAKFLEEQPVGTFLIRFSERSPGSVSLPARDDEKIWQLFVSEKDMTQNKGLVDVVRNQPNLKQIIHFGEEAKLFRSSKDALFGDPVLIFVPPGYVRAT